MELITMSSAGVALYCGWLAVKDEVRCWRCYRAAAVKAGEKSGSGNPFRYGCCLLTASVSRR